MVDRRRGAFSHAWLFALALLALASAPLHDAAAQSSQRIAAVVNDEAITGVELAERIEFAILSSGLASDAESRRRIAPQILRGVIDERLQLQEAAATGVEVSAEELQTALERVAQQNGLGLPQLLRILRERGLPERVLSEQVRAQVAWVKLVNRRFGQRARVTPEQIDVEIAELERSAADPAYLLAEIVLPIYDRAQEASVRRDAEGVLRALAGGAPFDALARQISAAPSAARGGDVGWVRASRLDPVLEPVVASLPVGRASPPIRTNQGYHIVLLRERRAGLADLGGAVEFRLAQLFFPSSDALGPAARRRALTQAASIRADLDGCDAIIGAAQRLGLPSSGDLGWLAASDLPSELAAPLASLEIGEISEPLSGVAGVHLIGLCERRGGETADKEGLREDIRVRLTEEQLERFARRYMRELRQDAYIEIRL